MTKNSPTVKPNRPITKKLPEKVSNVISYHGLYKFNNDSRVGVNLTRHETCVRRE